MAIKVVLLSDADLAEGTVPTNHNHALLIKGV